MAQILPERGESTQGSVCPQSSFLGSVKVQSRPGAVVAEEGTQEQKERKEQSSHTSWLTVHGSG